MNMVRKEIRDLTFHQRKIQSALLNDDCLTEDETALIRQCASELLEKIPAPSKTWTNLTQPVDEGSAR